MTCCAEVWAAGFLTALLPYRRAAMVWDKYPFPLDGWGKAGWDCQTAWATLGK